MTTTHLLSRRECADRARISVGTLDKLLAKPSGPNVTRLGRKVFVAELDFERWLASLSRPASDAEQPAGAGAGA